jgi:hypothetical protein
MKPSLAAADEPVRVRFAREGGLTMLTLRIKQMNSLNRKDFFSHRRVSVAAFVLLAVAVCASVFVGRSGATLAKGGRVTGSNNLSIRKPIAICTPDSNLIVNGDAEADSTEIGDGSTDLNVSAWENETGEFSVVRYGAPSGFPTSTDPGPANRGNFFFVAGYGEISSGSQVIDLSGCSSQIDGGAQQF